MSLRSMIQTVPFISHQKKQNSQNGLKHYLHLNLTIHVTRDCVFLFHQFQPWSDLVLRKLYQRKNNMMKKTTAFAALDKFIFFIFRFYQSLHVKTLTFWYQNC